MLDIDTAIRHCLEVAEQNTQGLYDAIALGGQNPTQEEIDNCEQCAADHRQLAEWLKEFKEAKRLLKAAVEDMHIEDMCDVCVERIPNSPIRCPDGSNCFVWRYKDEALKLIGEDVNGI